MKYKVLFILFLQVLFFSSLAAQTKEELIAVRDYYVQNTDKFLTVKGLELRPEMKMKDALNHFESKGFVRSDLFKYAEENFGLYDLKGTFFNYYNCKVSILPINYNKAIVRRIAISLPYQDTFKSLFHDYDHLKSALQEKYYMSSCEETFDDNFVKESSSDFLKLNALKKDEASFECRFQVSEDGVSLILGYVVLKIDHTTTDFETKYNVTVIYCTSDDVIEQLTQSNDDI